MLILSQDKNEIININNVIDIHIEENILGLYIIYFESERHLRELGRYSSIERCREVLEEILDFYINIVQTHSVFVMPEE